MARVRSAEIVAVGSELLTPFRSDTNSLWLTGRLNELGIDVRLKTVVGDELGDLRSVLREAFARADVVITTGGLGPTADDLTREAVAGALGLELVSDAQVLDRIRARFERRGMTMPANNARQAQVPVGAVVLPNPLGTAPGLWIATDECICVMLPGPPRELEQIFESAVVPLLSPLSGGKRVYRRVITVTGLAESRVDEIAHPIYSALTSDVVPITTSILAGPGRIELHLTASGAGADAAGRALDAAVSRLAEPLGTAVVSTDGRRLEEVVADRLLEKRLRLAVAESCTGGMILGRLTDVPGSSQWLMGGVVAYDNAVKEQMLGVEPGLLAEHGAVSESVAAAMASGAATRLHADLGVAVTGIAGPTGGTPDKPVGTVVIAIAGYRTGVRRFRFGGDRTMVRQFSVAAALDMVRRALE